MSADIASSHEDNPRIRGTAHSSHRGSRPSAVSPRISARDQNRILNDPTHSDSHNHNSSAETIRRDIAVFLKDTKLNLLQNSIQAAAFLIAIFLEITLSMPFIVAIGITIYDNVLFEVRRRRSRSAFGYRQVILILESLFLITFYSTIVLYILQYSFMRFLYIAISFLFYTLLRIAIFRRRRDVAEYTALFDLVIFILRLFCAIQLFTLGLRLDDYINWTYTEVFWTSFLLLVLLFALSFITLLTFIRKICLFANRESPMHDVIGFLWCYLVFGGITYISTLLVIEAIQSLENNDLSIMTLGIILWLTYLCFMLSFHSIFHKKLYSFLVSLAVSATEEELDPTADHQSPQIRHVEINLNEKGDHDSDEQKHSIPHLLYKYTSTYFRMDRKAEHLKKEKKSSKKSSKKRDKEKKKQKEKKTDDVKVKEPKAKNKSPKKKSLVSSEIQKTQDEGRVHTILDTEANLNPILTEIAEEGENQFASERSINDEHSLNLKTQPTPKGSVSNRYKEMSPEKRIEDHEQDQEQVNHHLPMIESERGNRTDDSALTDKLKSHRLIVSQQTTERISKTFVLNSTRQHLEEESSIQRSAIDEESSKAPEKSSNLCMVCFDSPPDAVFMPCGHAGICYKCAIDIWENTDQCYLCRQAIEQLLQIDLENQAEDAFIVKTALQVLRENQ